MDSVLALLEALQPYLLVTLGAVGTYLGTGASERRSRRYALEDAAVEQERLERKEKLELFRSLLEQRGKYVLAQQAVIPGTAEEHWQKAVNLAAASGDNEVIQATEFFFRTEADDGGALLDLVSRKISELQNPIHMLKGRNQRSRRELKS